MEIFMLALLFVLASASVAGAEKVVGPDGSSVSGSVTVMGTGDISISGGPFVTTNSNGGVELIGGSMVTADGKGAPLSVLRTDIEYKITGTRGNLASNGQIANFLDVKGYSLWINNVDSQITRTNGAAIVNDIKGADNLVTYSNSNAEIIESANGIIHNLFNVAGGCYLSNEQTASVRGKSSRYTILNSLNGWTNGRVDNIMSISNNAFSNTDISSTLTNKIGLIARGDVRSDMSIKDLTKITGPYADSQMAVNWAKINSLNGKVWSKQDIYLAAK
ncbi:MAG: hypothetical protein WA093_04950 [Minisyncoccales bacterium]